MKIRPAWSGWEHGMRGSIALTPSPGVFTHFPHIPTDPNSLSDNAIMTIYPDRSGALWVGTSRRG